MSALGAEPATARDSAVAALTLLILVASMWAPIGLDAGATWDEWRAYSRLDAGERLVPNTTPGHLTRPFVWLPMVLAYRIQPDGFQALGAVHAALFLVKGLALYALLARLRPREPAPALIAAALSVTWPADDAMFWNTAVGYHFSLAGLLLAADWASAQRRILASIARELPLAAGGELRVVALSATPEPARVLGDSHVFSRALGYQLGGPGAPASVEAFLCLPHGSPDGLEGCRLLPDGIHDRAGRLLPYAATFVFDDDEATATFCSADRIPPRYMPGRERPWTAALERPAEPPRRTRPLLASLPAALYGPLEPRVSQVLLEFDKPVPGRGWELDPGRLSRLWTTATEASLNLALEPSRDQMVELTLAAALAPDVWEEMRLAVNGVPVPLHRVSTGLRFRGRIPRAALALDPENAELVVSVPRLVSPRSVGRGDDPRPLGVCVDRLQIAPETGLPRPGG